MYTVLVPKEGVLPGQEFETCSIHTKPVVGRWHNGLLDFGGKSAYDVLCLISCCPGFMSAALMERLLNGVKKQSQLLHCTQQLTALLGLDDDSFERKRKARKQKRDLRRSETDSVFAQ